MQDEKYRGMRWFKCDLQMQTPADAQHWQGEKLAQDNSNLEKVAEDYARACYEAGLDVIGITDHNFQSKEFIPILRSALDRLAGEYERRITLFPGFELEADVGKGIHVLCLFDPDTDLDTIDHVLTECGVSKPRVNKHGPAKSTHRLPEILKTIQKTQDDGTWRGIVIVPHVFEDSLFDSERLSEWLQREEYLNLDLLAVEVPKPVSRMSQNFQKLFGAGDDCDANWKRARPIATIMSSDNKKLMETDTTGRPVANSIGFRYTWIKMSEPSIESLRQAFLDNESRIRLPDDVVSDVNPAEKERHARILSVSITNADFLTDQEITFSQNLNCIIGGRGTGKSTILESMRLALGKDGDSRIDKETESRIERIRRLHREPDTEIRVRWRGVAGEEDTLVYKIHRGEAQISVDEREITDLASYLANIPVRFFSQQQINQITSDSGNMLLSLLDDYIQDELTKLEQEETEVRNEIERLFAVGRQLEQVNADILRITQEISDRERQLAALVSLQDHSKRHQDLKKADAYITQLRDGIESGVERINAMAVAVTSDFPEPNAVEQGWPEGEWFDRVQEYVRDENQKLLDRIQEVTDEFRNRVDATLFTDDKWQTVQALLQNADNEFENACAEKGISPDDVSRVQTTNQALNTKRAELTRKQDEQRRLRSEHDNLPDQLEKLHKTWRSAYLARTSIAKEIVELTKNIISLEVDFAADERSFDEAWGEIAPDGRTRLGRIWLELGKAIRKQFLTSLERAVECDDDACWSIWQMMENWFNGEPVPAELEAFLEKTETALSEIKTQLRSSTSDEWQSVRLTRIADRADLTLFRSNGQDVAGRISDGSLSDGQRNTAALALILAKGDTPLVFDQPEDELDSNYIFADLVPILRRMKSKRQIIVVTHNANVPVNADAEFVYALQTEAGQGIVRAQGGLDQRPVTEAVLEIMEGSEQAFKRRGEKYHF
ncbi:MAG: AAA family ATPase [Chloroflexi bacterium]|nr:AAA family ATPase [Chloroflexota bacterium]